MRRRTQPTSRIPNATASAAECRDSYGCVIATRDLIGPCFDYLIVSPDEMATILEPLIIVVMGVIVATIVMAVMLPMFDIATMAR